ncbi:Thiol:disulfide interchange protein DsbA [Buchnera aphidicola (Eriosoma grossulariae)]|uniref:DsbA family protein n=1 Tax=Buchnera aphidicola TaxID=9 RepID=UPI0034643AA3
MKKLFIFIISIIFSSNLFAQSFIEGEHYIRIPKRIHNVPTIVEFFSFFCTHCYQLEKQLNLNKKIENILSSKNKIQMCHVNFLNNQFDQMLTHIWQMAISIHAEKKILIPIFKYIHENTFALNKNNIKKIFIKYTNITSKKYNLLWNSYQVHQLIFNNQQLTKKIYLKYIPTFLINGKYIINNESFNNVSHHQFITEYINLLKYLIQQK